jgi:UDP-glucuronate 4-epimerase
MSSEHILVTGGAGFIGSHLCEALLEHGAKVLCLDNFCDFYEPSTKRQNLQKCLLNPDFTLIEGDIRSAQDIETAFETEAIDLVIHLAAMAGVRPSIQNPELYTEVNVKGTVNILQACQKYGVKRLIFASSSSVYGNNSKIPYSESDPVDNPISVYAATKKAGELLCHTWHHLYGISTVCLRFFTVYGPRQRPDLAIYKFCDLIGKNQSIPVFGDGSSSRDYTYIQDIISGVLGAIDYVHSGTVYEIINLGESVTQDLAGMIATLEDVLGKKAIRQLQPMQPGDVIRTWADISKATNLLGYAPSTDFETGIRCFVDWFRSKT